MTLGKSRAELTLKQLRNRLREGRVRTPVPRPKPTPEPEGFAHTLDRPRAKPVSKSESEKGFAHTLDRPPAKPLSEGERQKGFAYILDDPEKLKELREKLEKEERKRGRHLRRSRGLSI